MGCVGYRSGEILKLGNIKEFDPRVKFKFNSRRKPTDFRRVTRRRIVRVSNGFHVEGFALPHADPADTMTLVDGVKKRMGRVLPSIDNDYLNASAGKNGRCPEKIHPLFRGRRLNCINDLKRLSKWYSKRYLKPIDSDYDFDFDVWLTKTNYDEKRKDELRLVHDEIIHLRTVLGTRKFRKFVVKLFMKDEAYVEYKHCRGIYARDDYAKVIFGPIIKAIETFVYDCPDKWGSTPFIKHVPVAERADYIEERLGRVGVKFVVSDYSAFECHFSKDKMTSTVFPMYNYMLQGHPEAQFIMKIMQKCVSGTNIIQNKFFNLTCEASRMSGEMDTSLANGWCNLMWMTYANFIWGSHEDNCCVVEGDDNTSSCSNPPPEQIYAAMGCCVKQEFYTNISDASFCGLLADNVGKQTIADVHKVLGNIGWTTQQYAGANKKTLRMLARAKAMSYMVQYPACPIITEYSRMILRLTSGYDLRRALSRRGFYSNLWERDKLIAAMNTVKLDKHEEIHMQTRLMFESLYGVTISQQLLVEERLRSLDSVENLRIDLTDLVDFTHDGLHYYETYCVKYESSSPYVNGF